MVLFQLYLFLYKFGLSKAGYDEPMEGCLPDFVDIKGNKGYSWRPVL